MDRHELPLSLNEWSLRRWRAGLLHVLQQRRDEQWMALHRGRDLRACTLRREAVAQAVPEQT